mmetsp:Transcript_61132/g.145618  ORF Transcript_61132/g.145618 Transcript_61132/m.145618 type:complete len:85 (+) Transcript_61132:465-719(+)
MEVQEPLEAQVKFPANSGCKEDAIEVTRALLPTLAKVPQPTMALVVLLVVAPEASVLQAASGAQAASAAQEASAAPRERASVAL